MRRLHWTPFREGCGGDLACNSLGFIWRYSTGKKSEMKEFLVKIRVHFTLYIFFELKEDSRCVVHLCFMCTHNLLHKVNWKNKNFYFFLLLHIPAHYCSVVTTPVLRHYINNVAFMVLLSWRHANELPTLGLNKEMSFITIGRPASGK